jgi:hypothetical protein
MTDRNGRELIPTAAEARRPFNLHTRLTRPTTFHEYWSDWRRHRQASARKCHYRRTTASLQVPAGPLPATKGRKPGAR